VAIGEAIEADVPELLRELCAEGALGRKAGRGLYPAEAYDKPRVRA
jgi:3-hydroxyacyl-CoA dehydrogenase